ncbi:ricin-type beta-trefoil lectin domain protein [Kineococcus aurantiacus]|uniref:Ricin B lectin domain-containing protein n=1 Tax=Kineococcus aurantiacus TaxID=37633 RepID=A0A7Y9DIS7_9ACTN|nr:hypothetical protein [Kineococcus aurantiacus]
MQDEGAALLLVMTSVLVTAALSVLVLGLVLSEMLPTRVQAKRTETLAVAQAGVDAATSQMRAAIGSYNSDNVPFGGKAKLPCSLTGTVGTQSYKVSITYYDTDPTELSAAEQKIREVTCTAGSGTQYVPSHAVITSEGLAPAVKGQAADVGNRKVKALYSFELDNGNIAGGIMWSGPGTKYCLQADSATVGAAVKYVASASCAFNNVKQMWVYHTDYTIVLASTWKGARLCLQGNTTADADVVLAACDPKKPAQLWSYEGGARFKGQNSSNTDYGSRCLGTGSNVADDAIAGKPLRNGSCASNAEWGSFAPDPSVGAGAASYQTHQIVNYFEFGRCMDVTNEDINYSLMIIYPCKQDPSGGTKLKWNHKWFYTENVAGKQNIYVLQNNDASKKYCLTASAASVADDNANLVFRTCDGRVEQQFTRYYKMPDYADSYTFVDFTDRCLSVGPKWNNGNFSRLVSAKCNGGSAQKWNAPQLISDPGVSGVREVQHDVS